MLLDVLVQVNKKKVEKKLQELVDRSATNDLDKKQLNITEIV